jgi:hypothetical protein
MINISNSSLTSLPQISHITAKNFNVSNNNIFVLWNDDLPQGIEDFNLENNDLKCDGLLVDWPNSILHLNLSGNPIYSLDYVSTFPNRLISLNLSNTCLQGVFQAGMLPDTLESLNLSNTGVKHIFKFPKNLKEFIAKATNISIIPEFCNDAIERITVSQSFLTDGGLPNYWGKSLKFLDLNCNFIETVPANLPAGLEYMNLSTNKIQHLPFFPVIPETVQMIHLNSNRIFKIPEWFHKTRAKFTIENNCLTSSPMTINCLTDSYQWIGFKYISAARFIQEAWRKRQLKQFLRIVYRNTLVKYELIAKAMHPKRLGQFENISAEWQLVCEATTAATRPRLTAKDIRRRV